MGEMKTVQETIGPFFCIHNKIYAHTVPLAEAEPYGECLTSPLSHLDFWDSGLAAHFPGHEYEDFPRGRVVSKNGLFVLYIDRCLDSLSAITAILKTFGIEDAPWATDFDEHYQCPACLVRSNGSLVFDGHEGNRFWDKPDYLSALTRSQRTVFDTELQKAFSGMSGWKGFAAELSTDGRIQVLRGDSGGEFASIPHGLASSEAQSLALACQHALAIALDKPLAVFHPTAQMSREEGRRAREFYRTLPPDRVILSEPFADE